MTNADIENLLRVSEENSVPVAVKLLELAKAVQAYVEEYGSCEHANKSQWTSKHCTTDYCEYCDMSRSLDILMEVKL